MVTRRDIIKLAAAGLAGTALESQGAITRSAQALRGAMIGGAKKWQNPYVTDGLVAMWDGEWNAGFGVHDGAATVWKDLSGNGNDLTSVDGIFEEDCGALYSSPDGEKIGWRTSLPILTTIDARTPHMIDFIGHFRCDSSWNMNVMPFYTRNLSMSVYQRNIALFYSRFYRTDSNFFTTGAFCIQKDRIILDTKMEFAFPFMVDCPASNISSSEQLSENLYVDGANMPVSKSTVASMNGTDAVARTLAIADNFIKFNRICIYNRILTAAEIATNYAVDAARFNI